MEPDESTIDGSNTSPTVSSLPDFAQIFVFLQVFGVSLNLPPVSIKELEDFFTYGYQDSSFENTVVNIHWRLVRNVTRSDGLREWQRMAVKFARKYGLVSENLPYSDLSLETRVKLFRLACEDQFEFNVNFRKELKEFEMMEIPCIGVDSDGRRHWLLQDSNFDIRLYGESNYDEEPPAEAKWTELARSLPGLGVYINSLEARRRGVGGASEEGVADVDLDRGGEKVEPTLNGFVERTKESSGFDGEARDGGERTVDQNSTASESFSGSLSINDDSLLDDASRTNTATSGAEGGRESGKMEGEGELEGEVNVDHEGSNVMEKESGVGGGRKSSARRSKRKASVASKAKRARQSKEKASGRGRKRKCVEPAVVMEEAQEDQGGCLKCHRDVDYEQMLLCDDCDKECHTYCQYPQLWTIPKGKWTCPLCNEVQLINALKSVHSSLVVAREQYEKQLERKQRSVARLQKSGLLVQNIIEDADDGRRSRRCRKSVNYAELNDVYLPPLGPQDIVGKEGIGAAGGMHETRSRTRRNDVYIQEDYLASRVRTVSSRRRRWREMEEEEEGRGDGCGLEQQSRTSSRSGDRHGGTLDAIVEEDEGEREGEEDNEATTSFGHDSSQSGTWKAEEVVRKKPRFACLENNDDLSPVEVLVQQTFSPPSQLCQLSVPMFNAPPSDVSLSPTSHSPKVSIPPETHASVNSVPPKPLSPVIPGPPKPHDPIISVPPKPHSPVISGHPKTHAPIVPGPPKARSSVISSPTTHVSAASVSPIQASDSTISAPATRTPLPAPSNMRDGSTAFLPPPPVNIHSFLTPPRTNSPSLPPPPVNGPSFLASPFHAPSLPPPINGPSFLPPSIFPPSLPFPPLAYSANLASLSKNYTSVATDNHNTMKSTGIHSLSPSLLGRSGGEKLTPSLLTSGEKLTPSLPSSRENSVSGTQRTEPVVSGLNYLRAVNHSTNEIDHLLPQDQ